MDAPAAIGRLIASDRGGRGVSSLFRPSFLEDALSLAEGSSRVAVVSGFFVPSRSAPETDGPGGAVIFARALARSGRDAAIFTDSLCESALRACSNAAGGPEVVRADPLTIFWPSARSSGFIERLGPDAVNNRRGEDILPYPRLTESPLRAKVLAVGDGERGRGFSTALSELCPIMKVFPGYRR